jgi:hypothetical protein
MKRTISLYIVWVMAAVMLVVAVVGPPAINFGSSPRSYRYGSRSHSSGHGYYSQRKDFYTLLRWVCCAAFAYSAFTAFQMKQVAWTWVFAILAVLFNPVAPFYLQRTTWQMIDWGAIGVIVVAAVVFWQDKGTAKRKE